METDARRERKKDALYEKLRAVTNSTSSEKESIVLDASRYIVDLKQKVERLNQQQEVGTSETTPREAQQASLPMVTVETLEKGFLVNVMLEKKCPGLLVCILEVFEDLGLDVLDARVSCLDSFQFEAVGGGHSGGGCGEQGMDCDKMKEAILEAIENWSENNEQSSDNKVHGP